VGSFKQSRRESQSKSHLGKEQTQMKKPVWKTKDPTKSDKKLSPSQKASAKSMAKAAGRPYPNLVDNMRAGKKK
jgi:hypothetical protein